ncbi:MAG: hypothetical protein KDK70_24040 [Myxococcales bacterium]|nr:hypothetical protein [Myxococcales bacterium]
MTHRALRLVPLLTSLCLPACIIDLDGDLGSTIEGHLQPACVGVDAHSEQVTVDEPIHAVVVDNGVGDVTVRTHDEPGARVEADLFGDDPSEPWLRVEDGVLRVDASCKGCCGADLVLTVPATAALTVELGVGDLDVVGLQGAADLRVSTGDMTLGQLGGPLVLHVDTGEIEGEALEGAEATAHVGTGDVSLAYGPQAALESVTVDVGVGEVDLRVPAGSYDLHLDSGVGDVDVAGLQHGGGAQPRIQVDVGTGDIDVHGI